MAPSSAQILIIHCLYLYIADGVFIDKYSYHAIERVWPEAQQFCQDQFGTDLASVHSEQDQEIITTVSNGAKGWIGLHDIDQEGTFIWVDGTTFDYGSTLYILPWRPDRPNDYQGGEDCVMIESQSEFNNEWNDLRCTDYSIPQPIFCNKPSLLCNATNDVEWSAISGSWQIDSCQAVSDVPGIVMIDNKVWSEASMNNENYLAIEYMFSMDTMDTSMNYVGVAGMVIKNLYLCHHYFIGIIPDQNTVILQQISNTTRTVLATNSSFNHISKHYYPLQIILEGQSFIISIHGQEYIQFELDLNVTELSPYWRIGLWNNNLNVTAKSLYIEGTEASAEDYVDECDVLLPSSSTIDTIITNEISSTINIASTTDMTSSTSEFEHSVSTTETNVSVPLSSTKDTIITIDTNPAPDTDTTSSTSDLNATEFKNSTLAEKPVTPKGPKAKVLNSDETESTGLQLDPTMVFVGFSIMGCCILILILALVYKWRRVKRMRRFTSTRTDRTNISVIPGLHVQDSSGGGVGMFVNDDSSEFAQRDHGMSKHDIKCVNKLQVPDLIDVDSNSIKEGSKISDDEDSEMIAHQSTGGFNHEIGLDDGEFIIHSDNESQQRNMKETMSVELGDGGVENDEKSFEIKQLQDDNSSNWIDPGNLDLEEMMMEGNSTQNFFGDAN